MKDINNILTKITREINLFIAKLRNKSPNKAFSFDFNEQDTSWEIKWKSSQYYEEYFEMEIWSEGNLYYVRGEHIIDKVLSQVHETYFFYEGKTTDKLISNIDDILQNLKIAVLEVNNIDGALFLNRN